LLESFSLSIAGVEVDLAIRKIYTEGSEVEVDEVGLGEDRGDCVGEAGA
jgi:hypothetical protein